MFVLVGAQFAQTYSSLPRILTPSLFNLEQFLISPAYLHPAYSGPNSRSFVMGGFSIANKRYTLSRQGGCLLEVEACWRMDFMGTSCKMGASSRGRIIRGVELFLDLI